MERLSYPSPMLHPYNWEGYIQLPITRSNLEHLAKSLYAARHSFGAMDVLPPHTLKKAVNAALDCGVDYAVSFKEIAGEPIEFNANWGIGDRLFFRPFGYWTNGAVARLFVSLHKGDVLDGGRQYLQLAYQADRDYKAREAVIRFDFERGLEAFAMILRKEGGDLCLPIKGASAEIAATYGEVACRSYLDALACTDQTMFERVQVGPTHEIYRLTTDGWVHTEMASKPPTETLTEFIQKVTGKA